MHDIAEQDWQVLQSVKSAALDRLCAPVLAEIARIAANDSAGAHERFAEVCKLLHATDETIVDAFDDLRHENAIFKLATMRRRGLVTDEDLAHFGDETRATVAMLLKL